MTGPELVVQIESAPGGIDGLESALRGWAQRTFTALDAPAGEVTLRLVDDREIHGLNQQFRGKDKPTNVLSFPYDPIEEAGLALWGDIVISHETVAREADAQGKAFDAHLAHMVVHGCLHLMGYDHQDDAQALDMEGIERQIMAVLGYPDPYADPTPQ